MNYLFKKRNLLFLFSSVIALVMTSCGGFYRYKLFQTDSSVVVDSIKNQRGVTDRNYVLEPFDKFTFKVYTNNGEQLIDPNYEVSSVNSMPNSNATMHKDEVVYTIQSDSLVYLPMIGMVNLVGKTAYQADSILASKYEQFYKGAFVRIKIISKRVVVYGPSGGKIIPLEYENMNLIEVLALYGDVKLDANTTNIKVIRGDLNNPDVQVINLNTIEGMRKAQLDVVPGDIIYVEPTRKVFRETLMDVMPLITATTSILTLLVIVYSYNK
ncbi:MAG: polysaccharide biosynthesis/export family protein [Cytophagaceae bacterium]